MTAHQIDRMIAVAPSTTPAAASRPIYIPDRLDQPAILGVLRGLGVITVTAQAANTLLASGHKFSVKEVDEAMSKVSVSMIDRFKLKAAMSQHGILK
jgi:hypothetical protein